MKNRCIICHKEFVDNGPGVSTVCPECKESLRKIDIFRDCKATGGFVLSIPKIVPENKAATAPAADVVNHPSHYESGKFECIDVMLETQGKEATMGFCICNAFKYLYRHRRKNGVEDIKKAIWYLNEYVELEGMEE